MTPLLMMVTSPPLMPAPLKVSEKGLGTVKVYAGAMVLNANPPTVVLAENDRLVTFDPPKNAVPVGTVAGVQLAAVLKSELPGAVDQVASWPCAGIAASKAAAVVSKCVRIARPPAECLNTESTAFALWSFADAASKAIVFPLGSDDFSPLWLSGSALWLLILLRN